MPLPDADADFVRKRRQLIGAWAYVGGLLMASIAGLGAYLWLRVPLLANPLDTLERLDAGEVPDTSLLLSAGILPLVTLGLFGMMMCVVVVIYRAFAHERRYIAIIERLQQLERKRRSDA